MIMGNQAHEMTDEEFENFSNKIEIALAKSKAIKPNEGTTSRSAAMQDERDDFAREDVKQKLKGGMYSTDVIDHSVQNNHDIFKPMNKPNEKSVFEEKTEQRAKEEATRLKNRKANKAFSAMLRKEQDEQLDDWD